MLNPTLKSQFLLKPEIAYLNFGSFGACPKPIFDEYQKLQRELEEEPAQFITVKGIAYLKASRDALGKFVNCEGDDVVFVNNPSYAVNIIAKSLELNPGDEVLTTNIEYGACDKTWEYYCKQKGAKYVRQHITLPLVSTEQFVEDFFKGYSSKTKLVFISHITSTTALILPVKEIIKKAKEKGLTVMIDGAHVPGHIPLDIKELGADIYTGACHKWMMTPKGSSFLYVKKEMQGLFDPLVVSWGYNSNVSSGSKFIDYHQGQGTRDFSAFLTIPKAIEFMKQNDWPKVSSACRALAQKNGPAFCEVLGATALAPINDEFMGQMFSIPIKPLDPERLQRYLFQTYNIEIPVMRQGNDCYIRYSINAYNNQDDLDRLMTALKEVISVTDFISVPEPHRNT